MRRALHTIAAAGCLVAAATSPAHAAVTIDCAGRGAPFSVDSPLVDLLLNPAARALVDQATNGRVSKLPARFMGTEAPTFAAIMSLRSASAFTGLSADAVTALEPQLRALPVTEADKTARCARFDNDRPRFTLTRGRPHVLLFQKVNGFFHADALPAARAAFTAMAERKGWDLAVTDRGGAINPATLRQFDVVIWNNNSGDVLTVSQRAALKRYIEQGGSFIGLHGAGGDPVYFWDWYADSLLGARFKAHPMSPQFQEARVVVEARTHPIAKALPAEWRMTDEWYSFRNNPRAAGATVVLTLDEASYKPLDQMSGDLRMGDHPIAWSKCIGRGKTFYSAIGHRTESYSQPQNVALLEAAIDWSIDDRQACAAANPR
jgi:hypothetical protein